MNEEKIDEAMLPFFEYVQKLSVFKKGSLKDDENAFTMSIESVMIEMPLELDIQTDNFGKVTIGAAPPLYYVQTTIEPVFHSVKIMVVEEMVE